MFETIYTSTRKLEEVRRCWLHDPIEKYLEHRFSQGYSKGTVSNDAYILLRFASFIQERGARRVQDIPKWMEPFVNQCTTTHMRQAFLTSVNHLIKYLREEGLIRPKRPCTPAPRFFKYVSMYEQFLTEQRGLSDTSIVQVKRYCVRFLKWIYAEGVTKMSLMNRHVVSRFVICEGRHYARETMIHYCSMLRGFLSYLYTCNKLQADYSAVVVTPKTYKHQRCPRFLSREEIEAMLSSVDCQTAAGRRNYAMLMLLSTYGLRGIEITRLRLNDIDWRAETIHIQQRKARNHSAYALTPTVGEAILTYIEKGRPSNHHRQLFLSCNAPYGPICTTAVRHVVKKYLRLAGLTHKGAGAHTFRYSCAQRLFEDDFSIKVIGDYLGHRYLGTTQRYLKVDLKHLREVAINSGEELL